MNKVTLLGDSIIDNKVYVESDELSVLEHLEHISDDEFLQIALDGATTDHVLSSQLEHVSEEDTHTVLSVGGNDLLNNISFLTQDFRYSPNRVLEQLRQMLLPINKNYEAIVQKLTDYRATPLLCTVYEGDLVGSEEFDSIAESARSMVSFFNDSIYRIGSKYNIEVLELREIFVTSEDYANPIEPSHKGGQKFAKEIVRWVNSET